MLLQIGDGEYNDIIYGLRYAIMDLEGVIREGKQHPENFKHIVKTLKSTEKYITDFWNADKEDN